MGQGRRQAQEPAPTESREAFRMLGPSPPPSRGVTPKSTQLGPAVTRVALPASPWAPPRPAPPRPRAAGPLKARSTGAAPSVGQTLELRPPAGLGYGVPGHRAASLPAAPRPRAAAVSAEPGWHRAATSRPAAPLHPHGPDPRGRGVRGSRWQEEWPEGLRAHPQGLPTRSPCPARSAAETAAATWVAPTPRREEHLRAAAGSPRLGRERRGAPFRGTGAAGRPGLV